MKPILDTEQAPKEEEDPAEQPDVSEATPKDADADGESGDAMLKQIAAKAESSVPKQYKDGFNRIMAAGRKAMFSEQTFPEMVKYLGAIKGPEQVPQYVAHGVVKLITLIFNQSKGSMPLEPVGLCATMFMVDALEYLEQVKKMPIEKAVIDQTTMAVKDGILAWLKQAFKSKGMSDEDIAKGFAGKGGPPPEGPAKPAPPDQGAMAAVPEQEEA
jgi:hypothetical protein